MRDFVAKISDDDDIYVHISQGPTFWAVEFDEDALISPMEVLRVAELMLVMDSDLEVQYGESDPVKDMFKILRALVTYPQVK